MCAVKKNDPQSTAESDTIPFRLHPRVFASLGSELVTNEIVAVIELVKNSYDALAKRVDVRLVEADQKEEAELRKDERESQISTTEAREDEEGSTKQLNLEIEDYGIGMSRFIIENVWCVAATPYRLDNPVSEEGEMTRRVSGAKGLGRLSAARIGKQLELITKAQGEPCWKVNVSWPDLTNAQSLDSCYVKIRECPSENQLSHDGTLVRISDLNSEWDELRMQELREQLSRLVSPFTKIDDFKIWLTFPGGVEAEPIEIKAPKFLSRPPYLIKGHVDASGFVKGTYRFLSPQERGSRSSPIKELLWLSDESTKGSGSGKSKAAPSCGPFDFEIRAWDIDSKSIEEISQRFEINKSNIRANIRNYRGISLYRDGILVLPKSETARDWLGLDLRRISKVGGRLSTSQLVGYVAVTAEDNESIKDTSDRERLEQNESSEDFIFLIKSIVSILEDERSKDRLETAKEEPFSDLFARLSPSGLIENISRLVTEQAGASDVLPYVEEYGAEVQKTVDQIQRRLVYYSRLASLGVLAAMLVHEVRNHTFTIAGLVQEVRKLVNEGDSTSDYLEKHLILAERGVSSLERLAQRFAPLASRTFRSKRRDSVLEQIFQECAAMREKEINAKNVTIEYNRSKQTVVAVDPGELTAVLLNLLDNSLYWLTRVKDRPRRIKLHTALRNKGTRVYVQVDDSGPGIREGDEDRVFYPGVTKKPEGLGMGLTIASEIVAQYDGRMRVIQPGILGGASFGFDIPISTEAK